MKFKNKKRSFIRAVRICALMILFSITMRTPAFAENKSLSEELSSNTLPKENKQFMRAQPILNMNADTELDNLKEEITGIAESTILQYQNVITEQYEKILRSQESVMLISNTIDDFIKHKAMFDDIVAVLAQKQEIATEESIHGQLYSSANEAQRHIVDVANQTPSSGANYCARWVSTVYRNAGHGYIGGNANDMYYKWCASSDRSQLKIGMIIAVPSHNHNYAGSRWGHVGIYIGDGKVIENIGSIHVSTLDEWVTYYGTTYTPMWGWANGINLTP